MKKTKLLIAILIMLFMLLLLVKPVNANYQTVYGRFDSHYTTDWMSSIRQMETEGQAMGLKDTINETTLESNGGNNIDIHLAKNTEWGAMAILSASTLYGKQPQSTDTSYLKTTRYVYDDKSSTGYPIEDRRLRTTTGNNYGIYFYRYNGLKNVAGVMDSGDETAWYNVIASKYIDKYPADNSKHLSELSIQKPGDALNETYYWHGYASDYIRYNNYIIIRANETVFNYVVNSSSNTYAYACVVNGEGIN